MIYSSLAYFCKLSLAEVENMKMVDAEQPLKERYSADTYTGRGAVIEATGT